MASMKMNEDLIDELLKDHESSEQILGEKTLARSCPVFPPSCPFSRVRSSISSSRSYRRRHQK